MKSKRNINFVNDPDITKKLWLSLFLIFAFFAVNAFANTGVLEELNDWLIDEMGGSVGLAIGLIAFFTGIVAAIGTRAFMPVLWGMGIGLILGIILTVVQNTATTTLPIHSLATVLIN